MQIKYGNNHNGVIVGIEHQPELVKRGKNNVAMDDKTLLDSGKVMFVGELFYLIFIFFLLRHIFKFRGRWTIRTL